MATSLTAPTDSAERHVSAYLPALRDGQYFSHTTAARLWGCPLRFDPAEPLHVTAVLPGRAPRRPGVIGHHARELSAVDRKGFPVTSAVQTWLSLAAVVPVDELVVAADHLLLDPYQLDPADIRPYVTLEQVAEAVDRFHGRGARAAASALQLARVGAESRQETVLRLLLHRAGLPRPELNIDVMDAAGRVLGRGDLVYPAFRTVVEYDGEQHRLDDRQYERDEHRIESFFGAKWDVVRVRKAGLRAARADTVERVTRALMRGGWRP